MSYNNLVIINNEKVFRENNNFYCENLDLKIIPEELNEYYKVQYIVRSSNKKGKQNIKLSNIKVASNIFKFIYFVFKTFKIPNTSYLLVCITPYTFLSFLILFLFRKKRVFVYLFCSGHEEYKHILGSWSVWIYHIMYKIVTSNSKVIVCHERLFNKNKSCAQKPFLNFFVERYSDAYNLQLKELAAFHKDKVVSRSTFEDGYIALKLANACYKSLKLKKTIKL